MKPFKTGPKSFKQKLPADPAFTSGLGDESVNSDSSSINETTGGLDSNDSRSPELTNGAAATDYGLEFTGNSIAKADNTGNGQAIQKAQDQRKRTLKKQQHSEKSQDTVTTVVATTNKQQHKRKQKKPQLHKEMKKLSIQDDTKFMIPRGPFSRIVREILQNRSTSVTQVTKTAMEALQTSAEAYTQQRFEDAYLLAMHRGRVTLSIQDMLLIKYLRLLRVNHL